MIVSDSLCRTVTRFVRPTRAGYNLSLSLFTSLRGGAIKFRDTPRKTEACGVEITALRPPGNI